jgi:hypothetical protein
MAGLGFHRITENKGAFSQIPKRSPPEIFGGINENPTNIKIKKYNSNMHANKNNSQ